MEITTTLNRIKAEKPCTDGYKKLVESLGGPETYGMDTPVTFQQIYDSNGLDDTLWCLRATDEQHHHLWRHFAVDCAEQVAHMMEDERSKDALVVARRFADGLATEDDLAAAYDAATAARDTAWVAARDAAWVAACNGACSAAWYAAGDAQDAACEAQDAAQDAKKPIKRAQARLLLDYCKLGARPADSVQLLARYINEEKAR